MENTNFNEITQNETISRPESDPAVVNLEDLICCDAFAAENIENLKTELIEELMPLISLWNEQNAADSFEEADRLLKDIQPDPEGSAEEAAAETVFCDRPDEDQTPQDDRFDSEIPAEAPAEKSEEASEQGIICRQTDQLFNDVQQNQDFPETPDATQPKGFEISDQVNRLLENIPRDVHESANIQLKEPDLFRQADQLLQDVQPEAAIAAQAQLQNSHQKPLKNVEEPYDFDFVW